MRTTTLQPLEHTFTHGIDSFPGGGTRPAVPVTSVRAFTGIVAAFLSAVATLLRTSTLSKQPLLPPLGLGK